MFVLTSTGSLQDLDASLLHPFFCVLVGVFETAVLLTDLFSQALAVGQMVSHFSLQHICYNEEFMVSSVIARFQGRMATKQAQPYIRHHALQYI